MNFLDPAVFAFLLLGEGSIWKGDGRDELQGENQEQNKTTMASAVDTETFAEKETDPAPAPSWSAGCRDRIWDLADRGDILNERHRDSGESGGEKGPR